MLLTVYQVQVSDRFLPRSGGVHPCLPPLILSDLTVQFFYRMIQVFVICMHTHARKSTADCLVLRPYHASPPFFAFIVADTVRQIFSREIPFIGFEAADIREAVVCGGRPKVCRVGYHCTCRRTYIQTLMYRRSVCSHPETFTRHALLHLRCLEGILTKLGN